MKELSTRTVEVLRDAFQVAEKVLTAGAVQKLFRVTNAEVRDAIDELKRTATSNAHDVHKVAEMLRCAGTIYFLVRKGYVDTDTVSARVYDFTLDDYREALQRLAIPVGGENQ